MGNVRKKNTKSISGSTLFYGKHSTKKYIDYYNHIHYSEKLNTKIISNSILQTTDNNKASQVRSLYSSLKGL